MNTIKVEGVENMSEKKFICECGSSDTFYDERYAELICRKCGRIYFILNLLKDNET
jgi:hypothetical protein